MVPACCASGCSPFAGFPDNLDIARVHLWLAQEEILDKMRSKLRAIGKEKDIERPFVSDHFAKILLELKPGFATSPTSGKRISWQPVPGNPADDQCS